MASAAKPEVPVSFNPVNFRKFELGALVPAAGAAARDRVSIQPLEVSPAIAGILGSRPGAEALAWIAAALQMVLYRNSYQSEFDLPVIDLSGKGAGSDGGLSWLYRFNAEHCADTAASLAACAARWESNPVDAIPESDVAVMVADPASTDAELVDRVPGSAVLVLAIRAAGDGVSLSWLLRENPAIEDLAARLERHLWVLIAAMNAGAGVRLINLNILTDEELAWQRRNSRGAAVVREYVSLNAAVEAAAAMHPAKTAVVSAERSLTYAQLTDAAARFGNALHAAGVGPGDRVVVFLEPSEAVLIAILGIHRRGAVYVPVDPSFPAARIEAIVGETHPALIVTNTDAAAVTAFWRGEIREVSQLLAAGAEGPEAVAIDPDSASHIFFTSGTTGRPKGVVSTHRNLFHYLDAAVSRYGFAASDHFIAAARFTFSISLFELLVPIAAGGSVNILPRGAVLDIRSLAGLIQSATAFHFSPSLLKKLIPYIEENYSSYEAFEKLRHVSSGGDQVPPELLNKLPQVFTRADVFVIYGCSEISCMGCTFPVPREHRITRTRVGLPFQNVGMRLFDIHGNPVPRGVAGQVYFSGAGLVSSYLNQPELTAEKFQVIDGERFYNTADVGRLDEAGNLELLERLDFQVKIRGIRIELLEVEKWIKSHDAVRDCVVVAKVLGGDEKSLVAYLVADTGINTSDLIQYLSSKLPEYMVPATYVGLDALPTNHNGKLDRSQLPEPCKENLLLSSQFVSARDEVESFLVETWEGLFGIQGVGIDDVFFELGGDSLCAVQLLMKLEERYERQISIADLMSSPTIRGLSEVVRTKRNRAPEAVESVVVFAKGGSENPPIFFLDAVLLYKDLAEALQPLDRTLYGLYLQEDVALAKQNINSEGLRFGSIVARYVEQIRALQPHGPYSICGHSFGGLIALEAARELQNQGEAVQMLVLIDSWYPGFRYSMGPLGKMMEHLRIARHQGWQYITVRMRRRLAGILKRGAAEQAASGPADDPNNLNVRDLVRTIMEGRSYWPDRYQAPVVLFKAGRRGDYQPRSRHLGWKKILSDLSIYEVPGTHYSMLRTGAVEEMAQIIMGYAIEPYQ